MSSRSSVSVVVVTHDSACYIARCLEAVARQTHSPLEVLVIDNRSRDETLDVLRSVRAVRLVENPVNLGFAAGHNQGISLTEGEYYLALNPDVEMAPSFIEELVKAMALDPQVGSVSGKLLRAETSGGVPLLDSTGIYMTPSLRHLDRGAGQPDCGQYEEPEYIFGASGAAALYRRRMLEDVGVRGEYFDEDFFAYREDADLAWRAQLLGWRALYAPKAVAVHERRVLPERRRSLPAAINMHSVKNRFLLRIKNQTLLEFLVVLLPSTFRDLQVLVYVLLFERSSLPGLAFVLRHLGSTLSKRRWIMARRKVAARAMLSWFRFSPVAYHLGHEAAGGSDC